MTIPTINKSITPFAWLPLVLFCMIQIGATADYGVLVNATSALLLSFHTTVAQIQIANTMYPLVASALMIIGGFIGLMIGWKAVMQFGLVVFMLGELIAAMSPNMGIFTYGARILAGIGASMATPAMLGLVAAIYQGRSQALVFAAISASTGVASALGPIGGGAIIVVFGWRYAFLSLAILFAIALCVSIRMKSVEKPQKSLSFDTRGALLLGIAIGSVILGLLTINEFGLIHSKINSVNLLGFSPSLFIIAFGIAMFYLFLKWQRHLEKSDENMLLPPIFINNLQVRAGLCFISLVFMVTSSLGFLIITYLQIVIEFNALKTGIIMSSYAISLAIFSMMTPLLFKRLSPKLICRLGVIILIVSCFLLIYELQTVATDYSILLGLFFAGAGSGLIASQSNIVITHAIKQREAEQSGGAQGTMRNLGVAIGVALSGVVLIGALTITAKSSALSLPQLPPQAKTRIALVKSVPFLTNQEMEQMLQKKHIPPQQRRQLLVINEHARLSAARTVLLVLAFFFGLFLWPTRYLPKQSLMDHDTIEYEKGSS